MNIKKLQLLFNEDIKELILDTFNVQQIDHYYSNHLFVFKFKNHYYSINLKKQLLISLKQELDGSLIIDKFICEGQKRIMIFLNSINNNKLERKYLWMKQINN